MNKAFIVGLCMMLIVLSGVSATNYYYNATTGNDANDCSTSALACKTIADLNGKVLTAGDNVIGNSNELYRVNEFYDDYLIMNESGSSVSGNISFYNFTILGSINASSTNNWTQVPQVNISGTLSTIFYVNTQYYNVTMQNGAMILWYSYLQPGYNWLRGDLGVNYTSGTIMNGSVYLLAGNVSGTTCTASNESNTLGIGIKVNCSNSNAENIWIFYDSFISVNSTAKGGKSYKYQYALNKASSVWQNYNFCNVKNNKSDCGSYTNWDSLMGFAAVSVWNTTRTNTTLMIDWVQSVETDFQYAANDSLATESIRIGGVTSIAAGTYLYQEMKIIMKNTTTTHPNEILDIIDAFILDDGFNDTLTAGTNIWRLDTPTDDDVGNIVNGTEEIGGMSQGKRSAYTSLDTQGEFYKDTTTDYTYAYSSSNPATYYNGGLEISLGNTVNDELVKISGAYIKVDGFTIKNAGNAALLSYYNHHIYIDNSSFWNSGGIYESGSLRYGGCISFECTSKYSKVLNSFFYGCYDNAVGMEAPTSCTAGNNNLTQFEMAYNTILYSGTCSAYSNSDTTDGEMSYLDTHHNSCYQIGYGWVHQRPDKGIAFLFANAKTDGLVHDYNYTNNIVYDSHHEWINLGWDSTTRWLSSTFPNMNYNLYYLGNQTQKIYWNGSTYNNLSSFRTAKSQEVNGYEGDPLFLSLDPLSTDYLRPSGTACSMSSTGGYVGAVPCAADDVVVGGFDLFIYGSSLLRVKGNSVLRVL
jgi:hypothetical protein